VFTLSLNRRRHGPRPNTEREIGYTKLATLLLTCLLAGCSSMLPMTHDLKAVLSEQDVTRIAGETGLTAEQVRDPVIHEVKEVRLSCTGMVAKCFGSMPWYMKAIGSIPLACTEIRQLPTNIKTATIYSCWWTDPVTMAHERQHAQGDMHKYW
jgi:hypothetical protein